MKTILFATDYSETCQNAFEYLKNMITDSDFILNIIHVFDIPTISPSAIPTPSYSDWVTKKKVNQEKILQELLDELPMINRGAVEAIYGLMPAGDIAKAVSSYKPNLVVMGLRAKHSIVERIVGTVTDQTLRQLEVPVLVIPFGAQFQSFDQVLFPTYFSRPNNISKEDEEFLTELLDLGDLFKDSKIEMLNIRDETTMDSSVNIVHKNQPIEGINYTISEAHTVTEGIQKHILDKCVDLVLIQHINSRIWARIFNSSVTRKMMIDAKVPMVVFTDEYHKSN